jgi:hypothetical protein
MDGFLKALLIGAAAYVGYEIFLAPSTATTTAPASWTAVGGTAAEWASMTATNQAVWNAMAVSSQTAAQAASLLAYGSAASPVGTTLAAAAPVSVVTTAVSPATTNGISSLAALATAIQAAAAGDPNLANGNMPAGDNWNYYANQIMGKSFNPAWPKGPISFASYWASEAPVIGAQTGLGSIMAGLGSLARAHRGRMGMGDYEPSAFTPPMLTNNPNIPNDWN